MKAGNTNFASKISKLIFVLNQYKLNASIQIFRTKRQR